MLTVVCVLKSGGDFDKDYVFALREGVKEHLPTIEHKFICYTDIPIKNMSIRLLTEDLAGWFSKFEVFKMPGPVLYLDLDTVVVGELETLARDIMYSDETFWMLEAFSPIRKWASGILGWNGDWKWLIPYCKRYAGLYYMDQDCISRALTNSGITPQVIKRRHHKIYSYKHHCQKGLPGDAKIVCFHGKPRPKDVRETWMKISDLKFSGVAK